jgi:septum formation protein
MSHLPQLVLASTSIYRYELLKKTGFSFVTIKPTVDEDHLKTILLSEKKTPIEVAEYLSKKKAESVFTKARIVIGADQLISFNDQILGKPKTLTKAIEQLTQLNGQVHTLVTAVSVCTEKETFHINHLTQLKMKNLTQSEIAHYVQLDQPVDCAGSYKIEKSGICLFDKIETDDFSAIQGLPLIWLSTLLKGCGYELFKT